MLKLGGYINITIALGHIIGLFWADKMFKVIGIGKEMLALGLIHSTLPYLLTIFVSIVFFIFGLYGLSAANKIRKLPFLRPVIYIISVLYLFRGFGELIADNLQGINSVAEILFSLLALIIGLLFLIGGIEMQMDGTQ